ncbi:MAG: type II secretion system protein [Candidatus Methylacidiphilales bacterium]
MSRVRHYYRVRVRGFTLVELVVSLMVVALLGSLGMAGYMRSVAVANQTRCASNLRQIALGLQYYSRDHAGTYPPTTHTTGRLRIQQSWIYALVPYLGTFDETRVCPAEPSARKERILRMGATSYLTNDLVFDDENHNAFLKLAHPSSTMLVFILSENRAPSQTRDHIHGGEWLSWPAVLNDIEVDRHRLGARATDRLKGSSNYLFADGHVENIPASVIKERIVRGENISSPRKADQLSKL